MVSYGNVVTKCGFKGVPKAHNSKASWPPCFKTHHHCLPFSGGVLKPKREQEQHHFNQGTELFPCGSEQRSRADAGTCFLQKAAAAEEKGSEYLLALHQGVSTLKLCSWQWDKMGLATLFLWEEDTLSITLSIYINICSHKGVSRGLWYSCTERAGENTWKQ